MATDKLLAKLENFRNETKETNKMVKKFNDESPIERTKNNILSQIAESETYRIGILKSVSTFGRLFIFSLIRFVVIKLLSLYISKLEDSVPKLIPPLPKAWRKFIITKTI